MCTHHELNGHTAKQGVRDEMVDVGGGLYAVLGVSTSADAKAIRAAYHKLATKWHPDKWHTAADEEKSQAESRFKQIKAAFDTLSEDESRFSYDVANLKRKQ